MFTSALLAFILYSLVFLKLRATVHAHPSSTSIASRAQERNEKYEHRSARQMLLYPTYIQLNTLFELTNMCLVDRIHDYDRSHYFQSVPGLEWP